MKKILLIILLFIISSQINFATAQCIPDTSIYTAGGYLFPAKISDATAKVPYSQVLTFKIPKDTTIIRSGFTFPIHVDSSQLLYIRGIPSGYGFQCNSPGCVWNGGTLGCALLSGMADSTKIGQYPMWVFVITWFEIPNTPQQSEIDSSLYTFKINASTGLFEIEPYQLLKVFPNPVNNILTIELNDIKTTQNKIEVFDATGRTIFSKEFNKPSIYTTTENIDLSNFAKGIYSVLLTTDEGVCVRKVLKN